MERHAIARTPSPQAMTPPVSRPLLQTRPFFQDLPAVSPPSSRENALLPQEWDERLDRAARFGHRVEHLATHQEPQGELVSRAFAGRLRPGEVRPQRVPKVDLTRSELSSLAAAANEVVDPAATPVPDRLRNGTAVPVGGHIAVPGLPVGDSASGADLIEALGMTRVKGAAVEVSGSRYTLKLRQNPWYDAVTGELLDPQPGGEGNRGEQRNFNGVAAVWRRQRQATQQFSFEEIEQREQESREHEQQRQENRRQERQDRQQKQEELASQGIQIDPQASWGLEQQITRAHRASRSEERWNQAVSSMHVPLQFDGSFGRPIVSQQRSSRVSQNVLSNSLEESGLPAPLFLSQPPRHQHAEPTGQVGFLFQMAQALDRGDSPPLLALETSSRGRCDRCEHNPENLGLQGLIVRDPDRRLHGDTPNWEFPKGIPSGFIDDELGWNSEDERAIAQMGSDIDQSNRKKKTKKKGLRPTIKSQHPSNKDFNGPQPPPNGGGLGGMLPVK